MAQHLTAHTTMQSTGRTTAPADIVTYRLGEKMVYVTPAPNYEQALDFAQQVFPDELSHIKRQRITFSIAVVARGTRRSVRIAEMAWGAVVATLQRYEIIEILVQPQLNITTAIEDAPPQYLDTDSKEAVEFYSRSPRSCPPSPTPSRQSSPSARSARSLGSNEHKRGARAWLEKHFS